MPNVGRELRRVEQMLRASGLRLDAPARRELETLIFEGAAIVSRRGGGAKNETLARGNLDRFVEAIARRATASGFRMVEPHHIVAARAEICPCFPFGE
jgi:hypothetical protein